MSHVSMHETGEAWLSPRGGPSRLIRRAGGVAGAFVLFAVLLVHGDVAGKDARRAPGIYWGAYVSGAPYAGVDAPWDMRSVTHFEAHTHKRMSLLEWGQAWWECSSTCGLRPFRADLMQRVRRRGYVPVLSWDSKHEGSGPSDPAFTLRAIIRGHYDDHANDLVVEID